MGRRPKNGGLNRICQPNDGLRDGHTVRLNMDGPELKDKTDEEKKAYVERLHKKKRIEVETYLGQAMLMHVDKRVLMVPYHLS